MSIQYLYGLEISWILANIAFGPDQIMSQLLVEQGEFSAIFKFIKDMVLHGDTSQRQMILWLIANITGECKINAKLITDNIDLPTCLYQLIDVHQQSAEVVQVVAWNIDNMARHGLVQKKDLPKLAAILKTLMSKKNEDAISAMSRLLNTDDEGIELLCSGNLIEIIIKLLSENITNIYLRIPLVKSISLITTSQSNNLMS